ncbi:SSI family serine proteinase inhibitor [Streptomyces sp. AK02-04a]|uniref:SSI family serine proteinase inhibitor n=1 Tax=Streptomyces sp. AK02-04a TaxID=3028649 RepID=UPI0029BEDE5A|nr:SSI family serine proteinase inhibitor [Streptomyces sp. AK02-04a]MDX3763860.1 SSI family serine proteinase inhibitor [Streptomyces sp. AK02-04a]
MRTYKIAVASAAAIVAAVLPAASAAADQPSTHAKSHPLTVLVLTKAHAGINPNPAPEEAALLGCNPSWGWHPQAEEACATLKSVAGDFGKLNVNPSELCNKIFQPVTVTAQGWWKGKKVSYEKTFSNPCELQKTTGAVFGF